MFRNILVATDGSALSDLAVSQAVELAAALHARLVVMTASEPFHLLTTEAEQIADTEDEYRIHMQHRADRILGAAAEKAASHGVETATVHVDSDHPHEAIIATATGEHCDLIVMASHGRRGFSALVLGSETTKVLTHSTIPVLVVRAEGMPAQPVTAAGHAFPGAAFSARRD
ncbi:universal stress protein [Xanthobacter autotrophicus]|uniref:universal stress protein n=1 Tax=Xanthobacter TaxID=279 RepID=UPI0024AAA103|nr:universal stress protein [Xanthobacter autotrophicus]MDI4665479.1 universal stress protein [Xanthobacter autotrophicus]